MPQACPMLISVYSFVPLSQALLTLIPNKFPLHPLPPSFLPPSTTDNYFFPSKWDSSIFTWFFLLVSWVPCTMSSRYLSLGTYHTCIWGLLVPSIYLQNSECPCFWQLNNILLCNWTTCSVSILRIRDIWVASGFWLLQIRLLWTQWSLCPCGW